MFAHPARSEGFSQCKRRDVSRIKWKKKWLQKLYIRNIWKYIRGHTARGAELFSSASGRHVMVGVSSACVFNIIRNQSIKGDFLYICTVQYIPKTCVTHYKYGNHCAAQTTIMCVWLGNINSTCNVRTENKGCASVFWIRGLKIKLVLSHTVLNIWIYSRGVLPRIFVLFFKYATAYEKLENISSSTHTLKNCQRCVCMKVFGVHCTLCEGGDIIYIV